MDETKPATELQQPGEGSPLSKTANLLAYPVGAVSGVAALETSIRGTFYGNLAKRKMFTDLQRDTTAKLQEKLIDAVKAPGSLDIAEETKTIQEGYRLAVRDRIRKWGYNGMGDYWKCLHKNQKIQIATEAMTVAGITFGAMILLSENIDRIKSRLTGKSSSDDQSHTR